MRTLDLTPFFRSTVGFERLSRAVDAALRCNESALSYPPYDIETLGCDGYRITMAVAGFAAAGLEVAVEDSCLVIRGRAKGDAIPTVYLHRGIDERAFERRFQLAQGVGVSEARLGRGLLEIDLACAAPPSDETRRIPIATGAAGAPARGNGSGNGEPP